jgi:truncated hemoglobin YjbI
MKITQLLSGIDTYLNNEEQQFVESHDQIKITSLHEREQWIAQNLVRKGIYTISKDNNTLVKNSK